MQLLQNCQKLGSQSRGGSPLAGMQRLTHLLLHTCLKSPVSLCMDLMKVPWFSLWAARILSGSKTLNDSSGWSSGSANTKYSFFLLPAAQTGLLCCFQLGVDLWLQGFKPWNLVLLAKQVVTGGEDEPCQGSNTYPSLGRAFRHNGWAVLAGYNRA